MGETVINKKDSCMHNPQQDVLTVKDALDSIYTTLTPISGTDTLPISEAFQRILAKQIIAPINIPPSNNSAMDGYALNSQDIPRSGAIKTLKIIGTAFAGKPFAEKVKQGQCVRIMTGAVIPHPTDTVVIQENVEHQADTIRIDSTAVCANENIRQAGEDITAGDVILAEGKCLTPADIGLIASLGIGEVEVIRKLRIAFFSTGDELRSIGEKLTAGCIYDSNRYTLLGMLHDPNITVMDMGIITDNIQQLKKALDSATQASDLIITTGGVSVGDADFVKEILRQMGKINFWKVAIKPGRPLAFGKIKDTAFFGLPGNPVSVMVTFYQFVKPAISYLMTKKKQDTITIQVPCISKLRKRIGRIEYQRGILEKNENQQWIVKKTGQQGSGILRSMSQANCFIILPEESTSIKPGQIVTVQPFTHAIQ